MKKLIKSISAVFVAAAATACVEDAEKTLSSTPQPEPKVVISDISCTSFKASWKDITDAGSYTYIFNGGEEIETEENKLAFDNLSPNQSYTLAVRTNAGINGNHTASKFVTLRVVTEDYSTLTAPQPVLVAAYMSKTIIQWNSVYGATEYEYKVGSISGKTENCSVELGGFEAETQYTFEVKALSDDEFVKESETATLVFKTSSASEDIPQIILSHVETGSDYSKFNVFAVADVRYLYFGVPVSYFENHTDTQVRDSYLSSFLASIEAAGMSISSGIQQYSNTGTASYVETPLYPEMSYYIVAFGVNTSGQATTPLYKFQTRTLAEDTASVPDVAGKPWFTQKLYHQTNGIYNPSNCMWFYWKGENISKIKYLITSTNSYKLYFNCDPSLFLKYVNVKGNELDETNSDGAKILAGINSEKGFATRMSLSSSTSYTLGTLSINAAGDSTFVVNSLPTKSSAYYYDWVQVSLGTTKEDGSVLTGVFQFAYDSESADMNLQLKGIRYHFCKLADLKGISTDKAAEIVASKGTDLPQANIDIINTTGKLALTFGSDGSALEAETEYILLATFTERTGDSATRFAVATTAASTSQTATKGTSAPKARIEFHAPVLIDTYTPIIGDKF